MMDSDFASFTCHYGPLRLEIPYRAIATRMASQKPCAMFQEKEQRNGFKFTRGRGLSGDHTQGSNLDQDSYIKRMEIQNGAWAFSGRLQDSEEALAG